MKSGWMCARALTRRMLLAIAAVALAVGLGHPSAAQDKLKVAAVFETPIEEPWVNQIHVALLKAEKELGIEYDWSESVKSADFARVMREYAEKGYQLIMGDAFGAEQIARRPAPIPSSAPSSIRRRPRKPRWRSSNPAST